MKHLTKLIFEDVVINNHGDKINITVSQKPGYGFMAETGNTTHCFSKNEVTTGQVTDTLRFEPYVVVQIVNEALAVLLA